MTDAPPASPSADGHAIDVPLALMKMALALLDQETGATLAAAHLTHAIEARCGAE